MPYASSVIVKLLVLVALALSLGDLRDGTRINTQVTDEVSLLEAELSDPAPEPILVEHPISHIVPRRLVVLPDLLELPPRLPDTGRVFRPPRSLVA